MIYNTRQGLSGQVKEMIVEMIKTRDFKNNRLPAESRMAEELGVSVAVVREALQTDLVDGLMRAAYLALFIPNRIRICYIFDIDHRHIATFRSSSTSFFQNHFLAYHESQNV